MSSGSDDKSSRFSNGDNTCQPIYSTKNVRPSGEGLPGRRTTVKEVLNLVNWAHKLDRGSFGEGKTLSWDDLADCPLVSDVPKEPIRALTSVTLKSCKKVPPKRGQTSKKIPERNQPPAVGDALKCKLSELFDEEIFDSILPYILPDTQKSTDYQEIAERCLEKKVRHETGPLPKTKQCQTNQTPLTDIEVNIHVSDEYKNQKKDFKCPQRILMTKMNYFAEITSGQKLEEMDISVHCDIEVFEWIMNWVKQEPIDNGDRPIPEPSKVVAILVSAEFLQIEPLIKYCLSFIKHCINDVIAATPNMSCLSEFIVSRLAYMFSNTALESIIDERDKILSRLFCKFINFLSKPNSDVNKGHYSTLAFLYKCCRCQKFIHSELAKNMPCLPKFSRLDNSGNIQGFHEPDHSWSINKHIYKLKQELRNWRKIYWRLWGDCHFLFCLNCNNYFPVSQTNWCLYHKQNPQFYSIHDQRSPIGYYGCCGEKSFRFEILPNPTGCQYKAHISYHGQRNVSQVNKIAEKLNSVIFAEAPELKLQEKLTKFIQRDRSNSASSSLLLQVVDEFWWQGLETTPSKNPPCLLLKFHPNKDLKCLSDTKGNESPEPNSLCSRQANANPDLYDSSSINEEHGDESPVHLNNNCRRQTHHKCMLSMHNTRNWTPCLSNRNNQDNQRCNEEKIVQKYREYIIKKGFEQSDNKNIRHSDGGGLYVQVEEDWRQKNSIRGGLLAGSNGSVSRNGNANVPARDVKGVVCPGKGLTSYKGGKAKGHTGKMRSHVRTYH